MKNNWKKMGTIKKVSIELCVYFYIKDAALEMEQYNAVCEKTRANQGTLINSFIFPFALTDRF
jgi:hypothetical protein